MYSDTRCLAAWSCVMRLDGLVERRRRRNPLLRLVTATLATCFIVGAAFVGVYGWRGKTEIIAPPPPPPVDPIQTGSIPVGDAIRDMIEKDGKAARQHR
jgi:hypothetical protein